MTDKEILEGRLDLFTNDAWVSFTKELEEMAKSLENIQNIPDEKTLFLRRGQVDMLNHQTSVGSIRVRYLIPTFFNSIIFIDGGLVIWIASL